MSLNRFESGTPLYCLTLQCTGDDWCVVAIHFSQAGIQTQGSDRPGFLLVKGATSRTTKQTRRNTRHGDAKTTDQNYTHLLKYGVQRQAQASTSAVDDTMEPLWMVLSAWVQKRSSYLYSVLSFLF